MIKVCRLSISYGETTKDMKSVLNDALQKTGTTLAEISIDGPTYGTKTHYGNWVLTPVLDNEETRRIAQELGTKIDMQRGLLETSDIQSLNVGDKIKFRSVGEFGYCGDNEGKVIRKSDNEVSILKKGSRSRGWVLRPWDEVIGEIQTMKGR